MSVCVIVQYFKFPCRIESFGGPYLNKFKLVVGGEDAMLFETNKVLITWKKSLLYDMPITYIVV